jgi:phosphoribosylformylglycinamidine cyclo-ligase
LPGEYAAAGVDYTKLQRFKDKMVEVSKTTRAFPNARDVYMHELAHSHGAVWSYKGDMTPIWCSTHEGLGNKNWIAEWMYQFGDGLSHYEGIGVDVAMMAVNDLIAQGALPAVYLDEVAGGDSEWFTDQQRSSDLAAGFFTACQMAGMALGAGESPALRYLINAALPVKSAPSLSGTVVGIIAPARHLVTGENLRVGDRIIAVSSSGLHSNGISLLIKRAMELPDQFMTKLPNGNTLGEEALIPTRCYVPLIEALMANDVELHALLPGTGDGVAKLAFDKREFTYRIHSWFKEIPPLFLYMQELGVSLPDLLTTFNWGSGYYLYVPPIDEDLALKVASEAGFEAMEVGIVDEGKRQTIFGPAGDLILPPPVE